MFEKDYDQIGQRRYPWELVFPLLFALMGVHSTVSFAQVQPGDPCTFGQDHFIELQVPTSRLEEVCRRHQIGCEVLKDFDSLAQIQAVIGSRVNLILPLATVDLHVRAVDRYEIDRNNMSWQDVARLWHVNLGELRAKNLDKLEDKWRGPNFGLFESDVLLIPDNATSLTNLGNVRYFCADPN